MNQGNMKNYMVVIGLVMIFLAGFIIWRLPVGQGGFSDQREKQTTGVSSQMFAMNTIISMNAEGGDENTAIEEVKQLISRLENLWSVTKEGSEIYQLNHSRESVEVSPETETLILTTLKMARETEGALNPAIYPVLKAWGFTTKEYRIPGKEEIEELLSLTDYRNVRHEDNQFSVAEGMELDFGAVAKGYAGDLAAEIFKKHQVSSALLSLGGNICLIGNSPDGDPWEIGIRNPFGDGNIGSVQASDCHIITSGGYENYFTGEDGNRYWHILDPKTGAPADSGLSSVTIVGREGILCDALSTALFVMGKEKAEEFWRSRRDFEMLLITDQHEIYVTKGLAQNVQWNKEAPITNIYVIE